MWPSGAVRGRFGFLLFFSVGVSENNLHLICSFLIDSRLLLIWVLLCPALVRLFL